MEAFLIRVEQQDLQWVACYSNGVDIQLNANSYMDAVLEADLLQEPS